MEKKSESNDWKLCKYVLVYVYVFVCDVGNNFEKLIVQFLSTVKYISKRSKKNVSMFESYRWYRWGYR